MLRVIDHGTTEPQDSLALDAALLADLDAGRGPETLHLWESRRTAVVVGVSGVVERDVKGRACLDAGVPIMSRVSGGGAVVIGPGCLNFSLTLSLDRRPDLHDVARSYRVILGRLADQLAVPGLDIQGTADLAIAGRKVSGNAQRRGRRALLHHGTLLYRFDARAMERYLAEPDRRPAYRGRRTHAAFVADLPRRADEITQSLLAVSSLFGCDVFK